MKAVIHSMKVALVALAFAPAGCSLETEDGTVENGNEALSAGKVDEAIAAYAEAAAKLPESPPLDFDRGLAASLGGDHGGAASYLLRALGTKEPALVQKVKSALGVAYAREALALERAPAAPVDANAPNGPNGPNGPNAPGSPPDAASADGKPQIPTAAMDKWKLAVTFLSDALVLDPNDAEARRSLEVALLRVDPPCATRDDKYEDNDQSGSAKLLEVKADEPKESQAPEAAEAAAESAKDKLHLREQLFSCPDDDDWYALDLAAGDRVVLAPTVPKDAGRLAFELLKPDGSRAWGWTSSKDDGAPRFGFTVLPADAGKWAVHVSNVDVDEVSYGVEVTVRPACDKNEDRYEDDDVAAQAKSLTPGPVPDLKLCPGDEDWYAVTLAEGESLFLYAQPADKPEEGDEQKDDAGAAPGAPPVMPFAIEILDEAGTVRGRGAPIDRSQVSTLLMPGAGRYLVRVYDPATPGKEPFEGRYSLQVEVVPPCPEGDDRFEDNDDPTAATDFMEASQPQGQQGQPPQQQKGPPVVFARVCPGDVDWWKVTSAGDKPSIMSIVFDHGQGDLALELFDETGKSVAASDTSSPTQNGEGVALPMPEPPPDKGAAADPNAPPGADAPEAKAPPKTFTLKVSAKPDAQNFYLLRLDNPSGGGGGDSDKNDKKDDDAKDGDKSDKGKQDPPDQKDQKDQKDPKDDQGKDGDQPKDDAKKDQPNPLQDALDNLDRNPDNLPARDAARKSPLANQKPLKDW